MSFVTPDEQRAWDKVFRNQTKKRNCNKCGIQFKSQSNGNRTCSNCLNRTTRNLRNDDYKYCT